MVGLRCQGRGAPRQAFTGRALPAGLHKAGGGTVIKTEAVPLGVLASPAAGCQHRHGLWSRGSVWLPVRSRLAHHPPDPRRARLVQQHVSAKLQAINHSVRALRGQLYRRWLAVARRAAGGRAGRLAIGETVTVMLLSLSCLLSRYCHATVIYCHLLPLLLLW